MSEHAQALSTQTIQHQGWPRRPGDQYDTPPAVDTPVWVDAFGCWRQGVVTRAMRTRVDVRYVRNGSGDEHQRTFHLGAVRRREAAS